MSSEKSLSILLPVDLSEDANILHKSLDIYLNRNMEAVLLHVLDTEMLVSIEKSGIQEYHDIKSRIKEDAQNRIKEMSLKFGENTQSIVVEGIPFIEIIKLARDLKVDMIAMGTLSEKQKLENLFFGSTTERVLRGSPVPVFCLK
ncbi:MAG: universal stress protein [Spirochaetia bacterium]|nr:universal stress protein [Spirochaetia bacterium]